MRNEKEEVQYIWHDGATIPENLLISMAKTAGTYDGAKPYLFSLLAHGVMHGISDYINKVNEIREHCHVPPIPVPKEMEESSPRQKETDSMARKKFQMMKQEERKIVVAGVFRTDSLLFFQQNAIRKPYEQIGIYRTS